MKQKYIFITVIIIFIIALACIIAYKPNISANAKTIAPTLNANVVSLENYEESIVGKWDIVKIEYLENEETETFDENSYIIFYKNGTYYFNESKILDNGKYKIFNEKILFYQDDIEAEKFLSGDGKFNYAYLKKIDKSSISLNYPLIPRIVYFLKDLNYNENDK